MTFWITVTLETLMIPSYSARGTTPILFHPKRVGAVSLQIMKFIPVKVNYEYECLDDVLRELPIQICEFLFMKLPCCAWNPSEK